MKYFYTLLFILITLTTHANNLICSQLKNNTRLPFHYDIGRQGFHLNKGDTSPLIGFENSYQYYLLDGAITASLGGIDITENGRFSILTENIKISSRHHCKVAYLIYVYD